MNRVFKLSVDLLQNIDDIPNVHRINENDYLDISQKLASERYSFDESRIVARGNFNQISKFDFIANDLNIPILSLELASHLKLDSISLIDLVPMLLIDDTYLGEIYLENGLIKEDLPISTSYVTLKFKSQLSLCNKELSIFRKLKSKPKSLGILKKPVLNIPKEGFPNLFRIKESVSTLFASERTYSIIKQNNIKGCVFEEVETVNNTIS